MLCSSCSIRSSNKNIRGDTTMTQQGITETRMHSDSNLDSHYHKKDEHYPKGNRFLNVLIFIGWMLLAQIPIVLILFITNFSAKMDVTSGTLATLLFMLLAAVVIWLVRRYYQRHTYEPIKPFKRKDIMINIGWALLLRVIVIGMSFLMMAITGQAQTENDKALLGNFQGAKPSPDQLGQAFPVIVFALTLTFVAPYLEELIYRGIFKETLFKRSSFWLPFILSSLIFASQHGISNWVAVLMYIIMGMIFYLAYHRRHNVRDSMMVHMIHNGVTGIVIIVSYFIAMFS